MFIVELEKAAIWTVGRNKRPRLIARLPLIDPLPIHPFVERTAVVKHAIKNHTHASLVHLLHQLSKQRIARLQICQIRHT